MDKKAALMIKDSEAKDQLVQTVIGLAKDAPRREELQANIGRLAITDADQRIAAAVLGAL